MNSGKEIGQMDILNTVLIDVSDGLTRITYR